MRDPIDRRSRTRAGPPGGRDPIDRRSHTSAGPPGGRDLEGKRVLVVGLGKSGLAAARLLLREGARVLATDEKADLGPAADELRSAGAELQLGGFEETAFTGAELIVASPGVPLSLAPFQAARRAGVPIVGEVELASWFVDEPILGVTGTNGKSTTTALTGFICEAAGLRTFTGGNLGRPLAERALGARGEVVVCELSSFQLESIDTFHPRGAAILNLTPDHLDRYPSHQAYGQAKRRIFMSQTEADFAVINAHDRAVLELAAGIRPTVYTFGHGKPAAGGIRADEGALILRAADDLPDETYVLNNRALRGAHNRENAMAAILLARRFGVPAEKVQAGLDGYPGLPHRLEFVCSRHGVEWINDSKATNVDSTLVALRSFERGVVLIAGGRGKGAPYQPLVDLAPGRIRAVLTLGEDAEAIAKAFEGAVPVVACRDLQTAVGRAAELAREGDTVLFSPACASYDQFKSFEHRGERFKALVGAL